MTQFTFFILIVILMVLVALVLVLPAFFKDYNDDSDGIRQGNINAARERLQALREHIASNEIDTSTADECAQEIESQLFLELDHDEVSWSRERWNFSGITLVLLSVAVMAPLLYILLGTPKMLSSPASMAELAERLELRIAKSPDDLQSIVWLARVFVAQNRISEALTYYIRARDLAGDMPDLLAEQANMLLHHISDAVQLGELLQTGLKIAAQHPMLLWLAGVHAANQDDLQQALLYWQRAYDNLSNNPQQQQIVMERITQAERQLSMQRSPATIMGGKSEQDSLANDTGVLVTVSLGEGVTISAETTLFVFAKVIGNDLPMPLAVHRGIAKDLPLTVQLDDRKAMIPTLKMSNFDRYNIIARLSASGGISASSGDWFGTAKAQAGSEIKLVVDQQIP